MSLLKNFGSWAQGVGQRLGDVGSKTMDTVTKFISPAYAGQVEANKANKELAEYSYAKDLEMWQRQQDKNLELWNLQNQYDSPAAQMRRYQDAGLNPNLIYTQSNTGGTIATTQMPKYQRPEIRAATLDLPDRMSEALMRGMSVLSTFQDLRVKKAQEDNLLQDVVNKQTANAMAMLGLSEKREQSKYFAQAAKAQLDYQLMTLRKLSAETDKLHYDVGSAREDYTTKVWANRLRDKYGINPTSGNIVDTFLRSIIVNSENFGNQLKYDLKKIFQ